MDLYAILIWVPNFALPITWDRTTMVITRHMIVTLPHQRALIIFHDIRARKHFSIIIALEHEPTTSSKSNIILGIFDMEGGSETGNLGSRIVRIGVAPAKLLVNEFRLHSVNVTIKHV